MPKRRRPVNYDRQIVDYDSDDPLAAFRKRRKKGQKQKPVEPTTPNLLRQAVREELVELKWRDQFWSRRNAPTQLNMFITRHEQLEAYIFKGHAELTSQRAKLHTIFTEAVARIEKTKKKLGVNYDRALTFQLYQQIRHAQRRTRTSIEDHCFDAKEASRWTRLLLIRYFPASLFGGPNQRRLIKRLALLFTQPRSSEVQLFYLTEVLKVADFEWLKGVTKESIGCSIVARLANILINIVFVELRNAFYITENKSNQIQFYHKLEWRQLTKQHTQVMVSGKMLTPCDDKKDAANIRFIPSGNRFRLVMPFKPLLSKLETPFTYHGRSMTIGKVIVHLLAHLVSGLDGDERIVDVQTCEAMYTTLQSFLERNSERKLHAIQCDVEKCYDRLSINAVFKHAQKQIVKFLDRNEFLLARRNETNWTFQGGPKATSGDISLHRSLLMQWFERARTMRVRYAAEQFTFNFMPHSLIVSRMAVCLYLHHLGRRVLDKSLGSAEPKEPILLTRMVDDIMIMSTSQVQCEQVYGRLKDKLTMNEKKSQASASIDPRLIKSFDHDRPFQIAGCQISPDLKFIQPNAKAKKPLLSGAGATSSSSAQLVPMIYYKCTGLVKFYTRNCLTPMHHDPARFMRDFDAFIRRLFRLVATRLVAICRQLTPRQRETLPADLMARLIRFTKRRVRRQMVLNFTKTTFVSDATKTQLKNSIDPMIRRSCLEGLYLIAFILFTER